MSIICWYVSTVVIFCMHQRQFLIEEEVLDDIRSSEKNKLTVYQVRDVDFE